jgi:hypothetical protein
METTKKQNKWTTTTKKLINSTKANKKTITKGKKKAPTFAFGIVSKGNQNSLLFPHLAFV